MSIERESDLTVRIVEKAKSLGASLAGVAAVDALKGSPSPAIIGKMAPYSGVGTRSDSDTSEWHKIAWPAGAKSVVVIAIAHPGEKPELDWWDGDSGTPGNRLLIDTNRSLSEWMNTSLKIPNHPLHYHIEKGGIFLKDAAVLAGLGCIGKNNLLVTPRFGPRIRFRALLTEEALSPTGPVSFDPCKDCSEPCRKACPENAFGRILYFSENLGIDRLPARNGSYSRQLCNRRMENDIENAESIEIESGRPSRVRVKYCRRCEFSCPVGKK
jgi:epoxyqueuosine reductase